MSPEAVEARLNAYREVLISLLAALYPDERFAALIKSLEEDANFQNGHEDPGAEPGEAFAAEARIASEIRSLIDAAQARAGTTREH